MRSTSKNKSRVTGLLSSLAALLYLLAVAGCGYKGDLYLPAADKQETTEDVADETAADAGDKRK